MKVLNGKNPEASAREKSYREVGDEPAMLARALPEIPIIVDKDRYDAGAWARNELGCDVLVLDDGYQHLALARDLNILLIDATDTFGGFEMAPFGRLREPLYGIKRADVVIVTRADRAFDQGQTEAIIKLHCGAKVPVMYFSSLIIELRHMATGESYDVKEFTGWKVAVACGIANPEAFADDLLQVGISIVSESFFPDHHPFDQADVNAIIRAASDAGAEAIVTTAKDAVRLEGLNYGGDVPVYSARLQMQSDDEVRLKSLLLRTVSTKK